MNNAKAIAPEMVILPGGTFRMGSEARYENEKSVHEVTLSAFAIGRYEVTFAEYNAFCEATGREKPKYIIDGGRGKRPVINVSWEDAQAYADWLIQQTPDGVKYRLPTEAEWEYAARGGTKTNYWWGNDIGKNHANCKDDGCGDDFAYTAPVGSFPANPFSLHDTSGNVWEWVKDWYGEYSVDAQTNPIGPREGSLRVIRGGGWPTPPLFVPRTGAGLPRLFAATSWASASRERSPWTLPPLSRHPRW